MPRGKLSEKYVQNVGLEYLKEYYIRKYKKESIFARKEVKVKKKYGGGRADGLISFKDNEGRIFVVSMEAKSCKTNKNICFWYDNNKWRKHTFLVAILGLISSIIFFLESSWIVQWGLSFIFFIVLGFFYMIVTGEYIKYKVIDVIKQIETYPANEKWIALSTDSFNNLSIKEQNVLLNKCKKKYIGLLLVSSGEKVRIKNYPVNLKPRFTKKDYLTRYYIGKKIRKLI